jgi:hypothetical protein
MGCLIGCLAIGFPRAALFLVWLFGGNYLHRAYGSFIWPLLGFFFLPLTTLTFAFGVVSLGHGQMPAFGWLLTGLAVAADLGLIGGGQHGVRRYRRDGWR